MQVSSLQLLATAMNCKFCEHYYDFVLCAIMEVIVVNVYYSYQDINKIIEAAKNGDTEQLHIMFKERGFQVNICDRSIVSV